MAAIQEPKRAVTSSATSLPEVGGQNPADQKATIVFGSFQPQIATNAGSSSAQKPLEEEALLKAKHDQERILREAYEEFEKLKLSIDLPPAPVTPPTSTTTPSTPDVNLNNYLEEFEAKFSSDGAMMKMIESSVITSFNTELKLFTNFFQTLLSQPNKDLPKWLELQKQNKYQTYGFKVEGAMAANFEKPSPFWMSTLYKLWFELPCNLALIIPKLDKDIYSSWLSTYNTCVTKLTRLTFLNLGNYLTDIPPLVISFENDCAGFLNVKVKTFPNTQSEGKQWIENLTEQELHVLSEVTSYFENFINNIQAKNLMESVQILQQLAMWTPKVKALLPLYVEFSQKIESAGLSEFLNEKINEKMRVQFESQMSNLSSILAPKTS